MQTFLSIARSIMPGVTFAVLADVGAGPQDVLTIPADKIPSEVTVVATWQGKVRECRAEFLRSRNALVSGPRFFAKSITDELANIVKEGT